MPAFERQSPYYLWDALPELFVRIDAIEPPPMDYEGLDHVRMVSVLHAIVSRTALPPVEVEELSLGDYHHDLTLSVFTSLATRSNISRSPVQRPVYLPQPCT